MNDIIIAVGNILKNVTDNTRYRVLHISNTLIVICQMDISKLEIIDFQTSGILSLLKDSTLIIDTEESYKIFDENMLSESVRNAFHTKRAIVQEVVSVYGPYYRELKGKKPKPQLDEILKKYPYTKSTFWRFFTKYLQSGMKDYSLIDSKFFGMNAGKKYKYDVKPGRQAKYFGSTGVILTDEILGFFEEALKEYKSGRQQTINSAYDYMNLLHFTQTEIINGVQTLSLLPEYKRPTKRQFSYYVNKNLTPQKKDVIHTSAQEQRNNKRLLISDSLYGVVGPGDMVEIDACEADVSLVSSVDTNKTIGRPIVYFMIDIYTRVILAMSVALDNNSNLGVSSLFLNLSDDKKDYCNRYGMGFDDDRLWPSNIIPRRIRIDRGSEFKSKEFNRICIDLGIEKQIVSGGSGSLKGTVEQAFHQMHTRQNVHLENKGLIEKRYDSNHHKEAVLTIEDYTKMVINFVLTHNQQYFETYPLTQDMIKKGIRPCPSELWQYGVEKYGQPKPIPVKEQYLFTLMTPVKATISRRGIHYKGLWYLTDQDKKLARKMFEAGTKKIPFEVRIDMRDVGAVYYIQDNKLICAPLNELITGNSAYKGLTMKQYEDFLTAKKELDANGRIHNEDISVYNYAVNEQIASNIKKDTYSDSKNMRPSRELEKQRVSAGNNISERLDLDLTLSEKRTIPLGEENINISNNSKTDTQDSYASFEEALGIFDSKDEGEN